MEEGKKREGEREGARGEGEETRVTKGDKRETKKRYAEERKIK